MKPKVYVSKSNYASKQFIKLVQKFLSDFADPYEWRGGHGYNPGIIDEAKTVVMLPPSNNIIIRNDARYGSFYILTGKGTGDEVNYAMALGKFAYVAVQDSMDVFAFYRITHTAKHDTNDWQYDYYRVYMESLPRDIEEEISKLDKITTVNIQTSDEILRLDKHRRRGKYGR